MGYLDYTGLNHFWNKIKTRFATRENAVYYVEGTSTTAGTWTGTCNGLNSYYKGLKIVYKINVAGGSSTTTLNINDLGAKTVRKNTSKLTTHLPVGTVVLLVYTIINDVGYWVWADYDSNTKNTAGSTDTSSKIFLVGATSQAANPQTYSHDTVYAGTDGHLYSNSKQAVNLSDTQALTNKTYNGYTLGAACAKGVDTTPASGSANLITSGGAYTALDSKAPNNASWTNVFSGSVTAGSTLSTGLTYSSIAKYRFLVVKDSSGYNYMMSIFSDYLYGTVVYGTTVRSIYMNYVNNVLTINKFQSGTLGSSSLTNLSGTVAIYGII